jgi:hypothetical protein
MAVRKLTTSSIENNVWYKSMLAGNPAFSPSSFDLLETTVLGSNTASVTFSSLGSYSDYKHLQIRAVMRNGTSSNSSLNIRFNSVSTSSYAGHMLGGDGTSVTSSSIQPDTAIWNNRSPVVALGAPSDIFAPFIMDILDFGSSNKNKTIKALGGNHDGSFGTRTVYLSSGFLNSTSALTSIQLFPAAGTFATNSRFSLYGIK